MSTVDWPGRPAAVLFLSGCNLRCPFCFNSKLALGTEPREVDVNDIVATLKKSKPFVSGVVITGGEPTLQDIIPLCRQLKKAGFVIKLDTNGSNPRMVGQMLSEHLIDFVALDVKGPFTTAGYARSTGVDCTVHLDAIKRTLELVTGSGIEYECRSPIVLV